MAEGAYPGIHHAYEHVLVDVIATLLRRRLGIFEDHEEKNEDEKVDDELGDSVFENALFVRNLNFLIRSLHRKFDPHEFFSEVRAVTV